MAEKKKRKPYDERRKQRHSEVMKKWHAQQRKAQKEAADEARRRDYIERKATGNLTAEEQASERWSLDGMPELELPKTTAREV